MNGNPLNAGALHGGPDYVAVVTICKCACVENVTRPGASVAVVGRDDPYFLPDRYAIDILGKADIYCASTVRTSMGIPDIPYMRLAKWDYAYIRQLKPDVIVSIWEARRRSRSYLNYLPIIAEGESLFAKVAEHIMG